jgi:hypothetical protein
VNTFTFDWPISASQLVTQAEQGVNLAKLVMDGTMAVESWIIANRIVPALHEKGLKTLVFSHDTHHEKRCASCIPMPDGSAFICSVLGVWSPLEKYDAAHEVQYLGSRYAPGDHWSRGFDAMLSLPDGASQSVTPGEVARFWAEVTGIRLSGFETGIFDHIEAIGHGVADTVFTTQGRLGL